MSIVIRNVRIEDTERLLEIYSYYVKNTAINFDYDLMTVSDFREKILKITEKYPYLVAENDGEIVGFAYAGAFVGRAAYSWSCEMTIYLDHCHTKQGCGRKLYTALENKLHEMGILNLYACIACPVKYEDEYLTFNSEKFHEHMGFVKAGEFYKCGYKFGRWYNMIWMEKIIGKHDENTLPVKF